jgi:cytochrome P450
MNAEVARLRTASCAIRRNEGANFKLDNEWLVPKGTSVIIFSHDLALNKGTWSRRWPQMEEPLDCFAPGRFLAAGRPQKERRKGGQTHTGQFNTEGIDDLLVAFGAGSHVCPGRQFARAVQAATLAVLLGEYEIQFSDPDSAEQLMPPAGGVAYGTIKPSGQIRMRLRKRPPP